MSERKGEASAFLFVKKLKSWFQQERFNRNERQRQTKSSARACKVFKQLFAIAQHIAVRRAFSQYYNKTAFKGWNFENLKLDFLSLVRVKLSLLSFIAKINCKLLAAVLRKFMEIVIHSTKLCLDFSLEISLHYVSSLH